MPDEIVVSALQMVYTSRGHDTGNAIFHTDRHAFAYLAELQLGIDDFMHRYNSHRRYSKICYQTPLHYELESHPTAATVA